MRIRNFIFAILALTAQSCTTQKGSGFDEENFEKLWLVESEDQNYRVTFSGDTAEIVAPRGLTMWRREKMSGKTIIEYEACVVVSDSADRLSDLNCFWMASDPQHPDDILARASERNGVFANAYTLELYYTGFGGNRNKTTRFRRYTGDTRGVKDKNFRPEILTEYTDSAHLLRPNHWYKIKLTAEGGKATYTIDGETIVAYEDPQPLQSGWFGFRTTQSHTKICNFRYETERE